MPPLVFAQLRIVSGDEESFHYQFFFSESPINDKICPLNSELMARNVKESVNAKMVQSAIMLMVAARAQENGKEFIVMKVINLILYILYA